MGLNWNSRKLFTPAWVNAVRPTPEAGMPAMIRIWDPNQPGEYDWDAGEYTEGFTMLYDNEARVQPLRTAYDVEVRGNSTSRQAVLFSIPIKFIALDIQVGWQVEVYKCDFNPTLISKQYIVQEFLDSSNPAEKTFLCFVNQETRRSPWI